MSSLSLSNLISASQGNGFIASTGLVTISGTSETAFMYVSNPSTSVNTWNSFLRKFLAATASHTAIFKFYWNPVISVNGTAVTINNLLNGSKAQISQMNVYLSPTATSNGTLIGILSANNNENISNLPLLIASNNSMLITVTVSNASDQVLSELCWFET